MHGVILVSFSDFVGARFEADVARAVFENEPVYLVSKAYDDERFLALIKRTCETTGVSSGELLHDFGIFTARATFARLYPAFFTVAGAARPFLLTIEERIHELVRATIPNARPPQLRVTPLGDDGVHIAYTSPRRLCVLLTGLVEGTAEHYGEHADIDERACMRRGDAACLFDVRLNRNARAA